MKCTILGLRLNGTAMVPLTSVFSGEARDRQVVDIYGSLRILPSCYYGSAAQAIITVAC